MQRVIAERPEKHYLKPVALNQDGMLKMEDLLKQQSPAIFATDEPTLFSNRGLVLGNIIKRDFTYSGPQSLEDGSKIARTDVSENQVSIDYGDLRKQLLISGAAGTGKTHFCLYLLHMLWEKFNIPFLVIEPTNCEYRMPLLLCDAFGRLHRTGRSKSASRRARVYTLGDGTVSPLRLNGFEVSSGTQLNTHIDGLMSVFAAAFEMDMPLCDAFRRTLRSAYVARGWNIENNSNSRRSSIPPERSIELYPALNDLLEIADTEIDGFNYSTTTTIELKARLRAIIGNLMAWPKSEMFARENFLTRDELLNSPAVIEMKEIFDDAEKGFFLNMILLGLHDHCRARRGEMDSLVPELVLQHIIVIEDGHRLLNNQLVTRCFQKVDGINASAHLSSRLLSELSHYEQGVIISTRSPGQLVPAILGNTHLKIIYRLMCDADLNAVSAGPYLDDSHKRHIVSLGRRRAVAYTGKMPLPYYLATVYDMTMNVPEPDTIEESDAVVREEMTNIRLGNSL